MEGEEGLGRHGRGGRGKRNVYIHKISPNKNLIEKKRERERGRDLGGAVKSLSKSSTTNNNSRSKQQPIVKTTVFHIGKERERRRDGSG